MTPLPNPAPPSNGPVVPQQRPGLPPGWAPSPYEPPSEQQWGPAGPPSAPPAPAPVARRIGPWWLVAAVLVGALLAASVTWAIARPATPEPTSSAPSSPSLISSAPAVPTAATTDQQVCGDLDRVGGAFYNGYYKQLMLSGGHADAVPIQLSAQTSALTTVGAPAGQIDGAAAIAAASPAIGSAMTGMVRDAAIAGKGAADSSVSGVNHIPDLTSLLTTFTTSTVECTKAGYQPSWFNPSELAR
ncbi:MULTISPECIES: hypothetical protein [Pseudonocardia]|uniref:Uncharacterized protein n=2 Tax=Pseudonocardia TaxID=1847 RepID=A0A1Y2MQ93_PSEAH|nr:MULTISPECIES: hypothetical protein [Pseudonocardia]OSY37393.1 hypothetical protein BG845_04688 [Pseudonocardia autotrophica]TDN77281.1 hypothetical protein C8E95_6526 [Pseudonocardia autotrophica]BBG01301.1 hypothetical protein Pdca_25100 [Pseudonocardia autotrophica]GEC26028.1 hypothetical protein PSA01_30570 [Pseudonocardia saturnea]